MCPEPEKEPKVIGKKVRVYDREFGNNLPAIGTIITIRFLYGEESWAVRFDELQQHEITILRKFNGGFFNRKQCEIFEVEDIMSQNSEESELIECWNKFCNHYDINALDNCKIFTKLEFKRCMDFMGQGVRKNSTIKLGKAIPKSIEIKLSDNLGYIVKIGCGTFSFETKDSIKKAFCDFIDNPEEFEKKYYKINPVHVGVDMGSAMGDWTPNSWFPPIG